MVRRPGVLMLASLLLVAANLRTSITSVGSVLGQVGADTGLGGAELGLLGSLPLFAFAAVSPLVGWMSRRLGQERALLLALLVLAAATVLRSVPGGNGLLWIGTVLIGAAIAVGNVLVPALVKQHFPGRIAVVTGAYSASLSAFAALASGVAVPIASLAGWRVAIGCWAVLTLIGALIWAPRALRSPTVAAEARPAGSMWRSPTAWQVAVFMGAQSTTFYVLITWLPTVEAALGVSALAAGWHLFLLQVVGTLAGFAVPVFMHGRADLRAVAGAVSALMAAAMLGLVLAPTLVLVWIVVAGAASGSGLVVALTLMAQRARTADDAAALSGMVQGVGYLVAALGPILAGVLLDATGAWQWIVAVVLTAAVVQGAAALLAGRDRYAR